MDDIWAVATLGAALVIISLGSVWYLLDRTIRRATQDIVEAILMARQPESSTNEGTEVSLGGIIFSADDILEDRWPVETPARLPDGE